MAIILRPEQECVLVEAITFGLARTTDEALDQALETLRCRLPEPRPQGESGAERARAFEQWARSHPQRQPLREEAFQRENMTRE
jgi:hypothetical protein